MMRTPSVLAGILLFGSSGVAAQQAPPMVTDRPTQTAAATLVPVRALQLEAGAGYGRATIDVPGGIAHQNQLTLGLVLARFGITPRVEARLGFAGYQRVTQESQSVTGAGDLDVGVKVRLLEGRQNIPQAAFIGTVVLPTASENFGVDQVSIVVRLAFAHEIGERLGFGWNLGAVVARVDRPGGTTTDSEILYTAALGYALADRIGAFVEGFGFFSASAFSEDRHSLDAGFTFLLLPNLQLDTSGGIGLTDGAEDWFVGAGVSVRVPR